MNTLLPILAYGALTALAIKCLVIIVVVLVVAWAVTKIAGPPSIPAPFNWIIWIIVIIALILFIFYAFGIPLP